MMENSEQKRPVRLDTASKRSERKGFAGFFETLLRKFSVLLQVMMMLPLYVFACVCGGLGLVPALSFYHWVAKVSQTWPSPAQHFATGTSIIAAFFIFGFSSILILPTVNFVTRSNLRAWRGPYFSLEAIRWYIHNGAVYLLRYSFLEFVTPSPFLNWFYQLMGMKIGRGTIINSTCISDPSLITMGENVTIGGSATIVGHYGQGGYLVLAPVVIEDNVTIGLRAIIMGGAQIGKGAKILPNSVVLPKTVIPAGETWGGVPAQKISVFNRHAA
jgi:acetyltransferase-like isoleucine patch superfamily enzyme